MPVGEAMRKLVIRFAEFVCLLALIGAVIYAYYLGKQTESGILYAFLALLVGSVSIAGFLCLVEIAENSEKAARQPDLDSDTQLIVMPLDEGELRILVSSPIRVEIGQKEIGGKEFYAAIMLTTTRIVLLAHGRKIELRRKHLESKQMFSDGRLSLLHQGRAEPLGDGLSVRVTESSIGVSKDANGTV